MCRINAFSEMNCFVTSASAFQLCEHFLQSWNLEQFCNGIEGFFSKRQTSDVLDVLQTETSLRPAKGQSHSPTHSWRHKDGVAA